MLILALGLEQASPSADRKVVDGWLSKMAEALMGTARNEPDARRELDWARRNRARIELELANPSPKDGSEHVVMATTIEQLRDEDLIIAQPTVGGYVRMLTTGERLLMSWYGLRGRAICGTRSLSRIKIPSGGREMFYGYRLSLPEQVEVQERREEPRVRIAIDLAPRVDLYPAHHRDEPPVRGIGQDLSQGGMQIRTRHAGDRLRAGQKALMLVQLPEPVGVVREAVTIAGVEPGLRADEHIVRVQFTSGIRGMDGLLTILRARRKRRQRSI